MPKYIRSMKFYVHVYARKKRFPFALHVFFRIFAPKTIKLYL